MTTPIHVRWAFLSVVAIAALQGMPAQAQPRVVCNVGSADETFQTTHNTKANPFDMETVNSTHGFRFSGILLDNPRKFKSYVYYDSKDRLVLISKHEVMLGDNWCGQKLGVGETYSHYLENHLTYECEYRCAP